MSRRETGGKVVRVCRDGSHDAWTGHGEWEEEAGVNRETASGYIGTGDMGGNVSGMSGRIA